MPFLVGSAKRTVIKRFITVFIVSYLIEASTVMWEFFCRKDKIYFEELFLKQLFVDIEQNNVGYENVLNFFLVD